MLGKGKKCYKVNKLRLEFQGLQFIISSHKVVPIPALLTKIPRSFPAGDIQAMEKPTAQLMLFMGKRSLTWKCSHLLCFKDNP